MAASRVPLRRFERRLHERVQTFLEPDEHVLAAVVASTGPPPGAEAFGALLGFLSPVLALLGLLANSGRRFTTVALTNRGVVLLKNKDRKRPVAIERRLDGVSALGPLHDSAAGTWVEVGGEQLWIGGEWQIQLYSLRHPT